MRAVLVFGASGAIGQDLCRSFHAAGDQVTAVSRGGLSPAPELAFAQWRAWGAASGASWPDALQFDAVVWAQGANCNDDIFSFDLKAHEAVYAANVSYILSSLQMLLRNGLLAPLARLCIISSIWQNVARQDKLTYCITKSALQGLVQSLAVDLGKRGHTVNAILPGALETPMTRANLSSAQIERIENMTPTGRLSELRDICSAARFFCSAESGGITGQFLAADGGFSFARIV